MTDPDSVSVYEVLLAAARRHLTDDKAAARLAECVLNRVSEDPDLLVDTAALIDVMQQAADDIWRPSAPAGRPQVISS